MTDNEIKEWANVWHGLILAKNEATEMYHYIEWYEQGFYASDPLLRVVNIMFLYGERSTLAALNILFETYVIKFETYLALLDKIASTFEEMPLSTVIDFTKISSDGISVWGIIDSSFSLISSFDNSFFICSL